MTSQLVSRMGLAAHLIARAAGSIRHAAALGLLALLCLGVTPAVRAADSGPLDGVTASVAFSDKAGKKQGSDKLVFAAGKLALPGLQKQFAFTPAAYTVVQDKDGTVEFKATLTSTEHGSLAISGKIAKQQVTGTRSWSKPGKEAIEHSFSGTAKK